MKNILLEITFNGSFYHGWQIQKNAITVQQVLKEIIEKLTNEQIVLNGCSRTDAGVHANSFCCNFKTNSGIPSEKFADALNANLPSDIVVKKSENVPLDFHSRYDCKGKRYIYKILNSKSKNPFKEKLVYYYPYSIDVDLLNEQASDFVGEYDFTSFCASGSEVESKVRRIYDFTVERKDDEVIFSVTGNGFLYNMVRIMVGTLLDINTGKIEKDTIKEIIDKKSRANAGITVPGEGLYLDKVYYKEVLE